MLGNTLNGISLGLDRFMEAVAQQAAIRVENGPGPGATRWRPARRLVRDAIRVAMIPNPSTQDDGDGAVSLPE